MFLVADIVAALYLEYLPHEVSSSSNITLENLVTCKTFDVFIFTWDKARTADEARTIEFR